MRLFSYDHCPYCVKARMIFGLKSIHFELITLLNDDEETPIRMIGQKMLPILEKEDGSFMPESLDIIGFIDSLPEGGSRVVQPSKKDSQLNQWLKDVRNYHYALAMPRWIQMGLEEFSTQEAKNYFTKKKELSVGPFTKCIEETSRLVDQAHEHLPILENIIVGNPFFWGDQLTLDDFHVFATLRCLTATKQIKFPKKIDRYMNKISELAKVDLHWDRAL